MWKGKIDMKLKKHSIMIVPKSKKERFQLFCKFLLISIRMLYCYKYIININTTEENSKNWTKG